MEVVFCCIQQKGVKCSRDGICVRSKGVGTVDLCPIWEEAYDKALNC